jgi:hypothetical protein
MATTVTPHALDTVSVSLEQRAFEISKQLGRKFEETDLVQHPEADVLYDAALAYAIYYDGDFEYMRDMHYEAARKRKLSTGRAKGVLNCLAAEYRKREQRQAEAAGTGPARISIENAGVYVLPDGAIAKVQARRDKQGTYAKRWIEIRGERLNENDEHVKGEWQYEQGLVGRVAREGRKMTLEEAKAFILRYGQCVRCGTKLVAAGSVERGIGPTCRKYFGGAADGAAVLVGAA